MTAIRVTSNQHEVDHTCPYCSKTISTTPKASFSSFPNRTDELHLCTSCRKPIIISVGHNDNSPNLALRVLEITPTGKIDDSAPEAIDEPIKGDFQEAKRCFAVRAYKATATMCRRVIQVSAIWLGATPGNTLVQQIDQVAGMHKITPSLQEFAHMVRVIGNAGAHPSEHLTVLNEKDAQDILEFTEQFLEHVFVMPKRLAARTAKGEVKT